MKVSRIDKKRTGVVIALLLLLIIGSNVTIYKFEVVPNIPSKLASGKIQIEVVSNISNELALDKTLNNNGCGLQENPLAVPQLPMWINYTSEENERFDQVLQCYNRLHKRKDLDLDPFKSRLYCEMDDPPEIERVLSNYKRVWFIGDSVLYQTYLTLSCLAVPTLVRNEGIKQESASFMYNHSMGRTEIRYTPFGLRFDQNELELYKLSFPDAISSSTKNDAIIVNAGLHYHHKDGPKLKRAASFIANATTNATIYFMETTPETWPTSNGMFTPACMWFCECESLTDGRIVGNGSMVDYSSHRRNITGDLRFHHEVQQDKNLQHFYEPLIPHLTSFKKKNSSSYLYPYDRVPSYLPATWRNDISNPILKQSAHVKIVPLWLQLVASGKPHPRENGDCTHKSLVALMAMNEQLLRTMALPKSTDLSTSK